MHRGAGGRRRRRWRAIIATGVRSTAIFACIAAVGTGAGRGATVVATVPMRLHRVAQRGRRDAPAPVRPSAGCAGLGVGGGAVTVVFSSVL